MKQLAYFIFTLFILGACANSTKEVSAPLFIDPNYHGSCDPEVIYNPGDQNWYLYYTARKGNAENTWLATPIGVLKSKNLVDWEFLGYCKFDGIGGKKDAEATFWAPAIIAHNGKLHMFVTYKPDTLPLKGAWGGIGKIVHYETLNDNPVDGWTKVADMHDTTMNTIDATVYKDGEEFHVWFKGREKGSKKNELYQLVSKDLFSWESRGFSKSDVFNESVTGSGFEEAPYIFEWNKDKWLITDPHMGLFVYKGYDGDKWKFMGTILKEGGNRKYDNSMARHCSVAVKDGRAFLFYHVEPWRDYEGEPIFRQPLENRRSVLQMAELELTDGCIYCDRDKVLNLAVE